ncbi:TIGR02300 family protein [Pseudochrobactrum asaccharolyticum]|uniref:TIGR02300 family protein n=1 Tax=Pseudochrobactrum asaccharolyticum TaxID=354351 RepID=UPI000DEA9046|nr:TIGR02300 family protein [Pseudochrobactrum asaccharolyticum]MBX8799797.1 TIGR02300 family protein [Ochrobactrum sp. MR28]MBX8815447.1 TIGR02300 family protein [Ochrobactrum sp. MR31]MDR2311449.1 TIGR02300 family protein [Brucellaceae bacterium]
MAKSELGTKRIDPETGKKFYDLNKDPIVSPYTGKSYPLSYFVSSVDTRVEEEETETEELDTALDAPEFVSLEDADDEAKGDDIPDLDDDDDVDLGDDDDPFLTPDDEDEDDDMSGLLGGGGGVGDDDEG